MQTTATPRFNRIIERYYQPLFRFAVALCGDPEAALVFTQRTFQLAHECAPHRKDKSGISQWLFTILFTQFLKARVSPRQRRD